MFRCRPKKKIEPIELVATEANSGSTIDYFRVVIHQQFTSSHMALGIMVIFWVGKAENWPSLLFDG
jgi:hypothetical protein